MLSRVAGPLSSPIELLVGGFADVLITAGDLKCGVKETAVQFLGVTRELSNGNIGAVVWSPQRLYALLSP